MDYCENSAERVIFFVLIMTCINKINNVKYCKNR